MKVETIIRPDQRGVIFAEAYARRELLYFLIWRDIKIRYKQTVLGVAWALLVPLIQLLIFSVIFGRFAGIKPDGEYPYALFVLAGLMPWTFFSQAVTQGGQSLVNQQHMITKVYFPRLFVPMGAVGGCLIDFMITFAVYCGLLAWYDFMPSWQIIFLPVIAIWTVLTALGAAFLLSALTVAYRDFRYVIPVMIQSLMFVSPVVYPVNLVPERYQWLYALNPMAGIIDAFRSAILGKPWNAPTLLISAASTAALVYIGISYFRKTERRFADIA